MSFTEHFTYKTPASGRGNASLVVASITYKKDGNVQYTHHFAYDALGNIVEISVKNASLVEIENYQYIYDGFNRLIRENIKTTSYEQTILYTYDDYGDSNTNDNRGNITSIKRYAYTTGTPSGTPLSETRLFYKTSGWKDQITRVEEHVGGTLQRTSTYVYDSIGNITSITSDTNQSFDFEGRRLVEHIIGGVTYTYTYNDQGIRTSKSNGTTTTEYFLDGSLVLFEKTGNDVIYYTYDVDGSLLSMNYNGDEYFYIKNLQGDIIEIVDASGYTVARYRYDAWGNNIIDPWDSGLGIANINPYRYRGYRFDSETGLYYLNSRYYDPSIGRFISADSINYLDPSSEQGLNLYAYCGNNPVMYSDPSGNMPEWLKWTIGGAVIVGALIAVIATGGAAIAVGAFVGSLVGGGVGLISGVSFDENGFHFDSNKASTGFMLGSITGAISGAIGAKVGAMAKLGTFGQRAIMAGVDGTLSLGAYLGQAGIHGEKISLGGALISFSSGLFSFASSTGYKAFDAIWGPMMGAEIAWVYDLITGMDRRPNVATRRLTPYF